MAGTTPIYGLPYPQSSDLVSAYPALGQDLAEDLDGILAAKADISSVVPAYGLFHKPDIGAVCFTKTGPGAAHINAGTSVVIGTTLWTFTNDTSITMPSLTAGTDYFIYVSTTGTIQAVAATGTWPTPVASPPANSRLIGGFHYAPGGNASGRSGGDTTPAINPFSFWDLKWRPSAPDPRGMTLVANTFWSDIYLLGRSPQTDGTSKYNVNIADGETGSTTTCIIPTVFGGNGSTRYATHNWWNSAESLAAFGKHPPSYSQFAALAFGTTEASSIGSDQVTTKLNAAYTSKWGVMQASGVMWVWGAEFGGGAAAASWTANTESRGSTYQMENAAIFGGTWVESANSGSRASVWDYSPTVSNTRIGARGVCDHLTLV